MASLGQVEAQIGGLSADLKKTFTAVFAYVLREYRLGRPGSQARSENLRAVFLEATTPAATSTEFSLEHGLEAAPYLLLPVLDLQAVGSQIVPLRVTRAADARRVYLSSTVASAPVTVLVEG